MHAPQELPEQCLLMAEQYRRGHGAVVLQTALRTALSGGVLGRQTALLVTASLVSLLHRCDHAAVILQVCVPSAFHDAPSCDLPGLHLASLLCMLGGAIFTIY